MILDIVTMPDPVLRKKAAPVTRFDDELQELVDNMIPTMRDALGVEADPRRAQSGLVKGDSIEHAPSLASFAQRSEPVLPLESRTAPKQGGGAQGGGHRAAMSKVGRQSPVVRQSKAAAPRGVVIAQR